MNALQEYPRPQMVRESYVNLNGLWQAAFVNQADKMPQSFDCTINVPFSPECKMSGVMRALEADEFLWYRREIVLPKYENCRVLLHFGAVDRECEAFINGKSVGAHVGGYNAFYFDITDALDGNSAILTVRVSDNTDASEHSRGKQRTKRGGIWYTPQSGIWQTVWLEVVPQNYIKSVKTTPLYDDGKVDFFVETDSGAPCTVILGGKEYRAQSLEHFEIKMPDFTPWSPENPHLYNYQLVCGKDKISGYFAMRKFSVDTDENGVKRLFLNNKPYFHTGLLDQGYWQDSLYTPPSDEAMVFDIQLAKSMGFNMLRKHIKVEPMRWYYHCDRLGMLVWQDMVSGGGKYNVAAISAPLVTDIHVKDNKYKFFARNDKTCRDAYYSELAEMINQLYSCPCIAMWVPFNEGWGQFDAAKACDLILSIDKTRTIDHASGWHDQKIGDFRSWHVYFRPYKFKRDRLGRAVILTEFGGYNLRVDGHAFNDKNFGYKGYENSEKLLEAFKKLYETEIIPAKKKGLCAAVYTQLSDVEDELNGIVTYDREVVKLPAEEIAAINLRLKEEK